MEGLGVIIMPHNRSLRQPWSVGWLERERQFAVSQSISIGSQRAYASALHSFLNFCNIHNLPNEPTPNTLSLYITYESHHISPRSVQSYLSGVCNALELEYPNIRATRNHLLVVWTLKGCMKTFNKAILRKDTLTLSDAQSVARSLEQSSNHDDLLFATLFLIGFTCLQRLGELVVPDNPAHREYHKISLRHTVERSSSHIIYLLPSHKADTFFEGNKILILRTSLFPGIDTYKFVTQYLTQQDTLFPFLPELWLLQSGQPPTRSWFLNRLHTILPDCCNISGHSLRSGGATTLASLGVPDTRIQALGQWASETFRIYIQKHPLVLHALMHPD
jgi:hypothetical protein